MNGLAVFDLDGTLVDSASHCAGIVNAMLDARGAQARVTPEDARRHISAGAEILIAALLGGALIAIEPDLAEFRQRYASMPTPTTCLFPGVREGLAVLRQAGAGLAICSNKPQALCDKVLSDLGLADQFLAVVGGRRGAPSKPDPAHLRAAITLAGGRKGLASCYVGDSDLDHQVALRAGVPFILVTYGYAEPGLEALDALRAATFSETPELILELLATPSRRAVR